MAKRTSARTRSASAQGVDGHYYVLEDGTLRAGPEKWARQAINLYRKWKADAIVGEKNYGGAMVKYTISSIDSEIAIKEVTATRGKVVRAEPISALYAKGLVHHVGEFGDLEDQMCNFTTAGYMGDRSPDRADAKIWALSELSQVPTVSFHGVS